MKLFPGFPICLLFLATDLLAGAAIAAPKPPSAPDACDPRTVAQPVAVQLSSVARGTDFGDSARILRLTEGAQGKYFVAADGIDYGDAAGVDRALRSVALAHDSRSRIQGYESPFVGGLAATLAVAVQARMPDASPADAHVRRVLARRAWIEKARANPYLARAWKDLSARLLHPKKRESAADSLLAGEAARIDEELSGKVAPRGQLSDEELTAFQVINQTVAEHYVALAKSPELRERMAVPKDLELALGIFHGKNPAESVDRVTGRWRAALLARNLSRIYCAAAAEGKPLLVLTDPATMPALAEELAKLGPIPFKTSNGTVELGNAIVGAFARPGEFLEELNRRPCEGVPGESGSPSADPAAVPAVPAPTAPLPSKAERDAWYDRALASERVLRFKALADELGRAVLPHPENAHLEVARTRAGLVLTLRCPDADLPELASGHHVERFPSDAQFESFEKRFNELPMAETRSSVSRGMRSQSNRDDDFEVITLKIAAPWASAP